MDLKDALTALRRGWQLPAVGVLIALAAALSLHAMESPQYQATGSYVVSPGAAAASDDVTEGVKTLDSSRSRSIMTTLTEISESDVVRNEAASFLGLDPADVADYEVDSIVVPEANVIETTVTGPDPELAAALAAAVGDTGGLRFVGLYRIYDVVSLDQPEVPSAPINTGLFQLSMMTSALGLFAGAVAALLRHAALDGRSRTVRSRLSAYDKNVTPIEEHDRFQRVG